MLHVDDIDDLAYNTARAPGICNDVNTRDNSQRCGLATQLMYLCYIDPDITRGGGFDASNDPNCFENGGDRQQQADTNCEILIFVLNSSDPLDAATGYLSAALQADFPMMFTFSAYDAYGEILNVEQAKQEYGPNPLLFNEQHGEFWYFCKCRDARRQECLQMD